MLLAAIRTSKRGRFLEGSKKYFFSQICFKYRVIAVFAICFLKKKDVELNPAGCDTFYLEIQFLFC